MGLLFSKYASPKVTQWKPSGKPSLLVDLREINSLIPADYNNNKHPVSTISDAAQQLAGKSLFCKLNFSQAYSCLQMADHRSVRCLHSILLAEILPTIDLHKLPADLSPRSQVSFVICWGCKCSQYVDDNRIAANNATDFSRNIRHSGGLQDLSPCRHYNDTYDPSAIKKFYSQHGWKS